MQRLFDVRVTILFFLAMATLLACSDSGTAESDCEPPNVFTNGQCFYMDTAAYPNGDGGVPPLSDGLDSPYGDTTGEGGDSITGLADGDDCIQGMKSCHNLITPMVCVGGSWVIGDPCPDEGTCINGTCQGVGSICVPGTPEGCFNSTQLKICDENGTGYFPESCPEGSFCLNGECGDKLCEPGSLTCLTIVGPGECNAEGTAFDPLPVCEEGGVCEDGICKSGCSGLVKYGTSYIGCEYWSVDLDQYPDPFGDPVNAPYGVVISNPGETAATVSFVAGTGIAVDNPNPTILPGEARKFILPSLNDDGSGITQKSIRIQSDRPIMVHQFNPMDNVEVYSNDASLLLPVNALGEEYYIFSWPTTPLGTIDFPTDGLADCCTDSDCGGGEVCCEVFGLMYSCEDNCSFPMAPSTCEEGDSGGLGDLESQKGYFTIVAASAGTTQVTVDTTAIVVAGPGVQAMEAGDTQSFTLSQFDVLTLECDLAPGQSSGGFMGLPNMTDLDLTGSHVVADKPIVVWGGHEEAVVGEKQSEGDDNCCAEHLEEQLFPVDTWRDELFCVKTRPRSVPSESDLWRILAAENGTSLSTNPAIPGIHGITLQAGQWIEAYTTESFMVTATGPIQAAQYTVGQGLTSTVTGDPSMILAVPVEQYRSDYILMTPDGYSENHISVIRPAGVEITLDGSPIDGSVFAGFGDGSWERGYVTVSEGLHQLEASQPFGLSAYGWSSAVSYGYPGGMDLSTQ